MSNSEPVITALMLSDTVIREAGSNKLTLVGCFTQYNLPQLPMQVGPFTATIVLTNVGNVDKLTFSVQLTEPSTGHVLSNASGTVERKLQADSRDEYLELYVQMPPTVFQQPGKYEVKVKIDGADFAKRPIFVNEIQQNLDLK